MLRVATFVNLELKVVTLRSHDYRKALEMHLKYVGDDWLLAEIQLQVWVVHELDYLTFSEELKQRVGIRGYDHLD